MFEYKKVIIVGLIATTVMHLTKTIDQLEATHNNKSHSAVAQRANHVLHDNDESALQLVTACTKCGKKRH